MKFCPKCEARMKVKQEEKKNYCPRCGFVSYQTDDINNTPLKSEIQKPEKLWNQKQQQKLFQP